MLCSSRNAPGYGFHTAEFSSSYLISGFKVSLNVTPTTTISGTNPEYRTKFSKLSKVSGTKTSRANGKAPAETVRTYVFGILDAKTDGENAFFQKQTSSTFC